MSTHFTHRPSTSYNAFDTIAEPGRRPQPMFLRRTKARRNKAAVLGAICCALLLLWGWRSSGIDIRPSMARLTGTNLTNPFSSHFGTTSEVPLTIASEDPLYPDIPNPNLEAAKNHTSFHLLIPASASNPEFCKTILSAFVLGYPAPTLINWGVETGDGKVFKESASHTAKIKGVHAFLSDDAKVKDGDMVLIVDGYDIWFQLPPRIMLDRYNKMQERANEELSRRYGKISEDQNGDSLPERVPKYEQHILFGADKLCWPNQKEDPACAAVPYSPLPKDIYGEETDIDPKAFHNRPRWLNSGTIMGRAKDVRDLYDAALQRVEQGAGGLGDQYVFAEIFGEQEHRRETIRKENQGAGERFLNYVTDVLGQSPSPLAANVTIKNVTIVPGRRYEYGIGLDYESNLFQTMTHSIEDMSFIYYNTSTDLFAFQKGRPLYLPSDLASANKPLTYASPGNHTRESDPNIKTLLLPYSARLDNLPDQNAPEAGPSWRGIPLATNTYAASIPAILHINGDKSLLDSWWSKMWFFPYGRALLRRFIRSTQTLEAAIAADEGGKNWWDMRGGRGGVWTGHASWMPWSEICPNVEDDLFHDGLGVFGKEEGDPRRVNSFGKVVIGEEE